MRVEKISEAQRQTQLIDAKTHLESIAKIHKTDVATLVQEAYAAGANAAPYQSRAILLYERIERLS